MAKEFFKDLPDTSTPLNASRLNGLLDGEEALGNIVVDSISTKNLFDIYMPVTTRNGANAVIVYDLIRVVSTSNGTYSNIKYKIIDITNHAGEKITLSTYVALGTGQPAIAIGTFDSEGGNINQISTKKISADGRYSVTATLPSTITSTNQYVYVAFFVSSGASSTAGNYCQFSSIQLNFGEETTFKPYIDMNTNNFAKTKLFNLGTTSGALFKTGISTYRSFGGLAIVLQGNNTPTIEYFGRRYSDYSGQADFVTTNSNMFGVDENGEMTITSVGTGSTRVILFYD